MNYICFPGHPSPPGHQQAIPQAAESIAHLVVPTTIVNICFARGPFRGGSHSSLSLRAMTSRATSASRRSVLNEYARKRISAAATLIPA
jgi:hypothetical protein